MFVRVKDNLIVSTQHIVAVQQRPGVDVVDIYTDNTDIWEIYDTDLDTVLGLIEGRTRYVKKPEEEKP